MHWGINLPSKTPPHLSWQSPLKSGNCLRPPLYWVFVNSPLKVRFFSKYPKYQSFSSSTPCYLLKVTKFCVKISQFEFLVMTEKNIVVYKLFCHQIFQILIYLFFKIATPLKKVTSSFPATPLSKLRTCQAPPPVFENLVGGTNEGMKVAALLHNYLIVKYRVFGISVMDILSENFFFNSRKTYDSILFKLDLSNSENQ